MTTTSKGGVHGAVSDNIFYIIWFDPHHNLYPDKNHGGLKRIIPPSTCCKDRDCEIEHLKNELKIAKRECQFWERFSQEEIGKNKIVATNIAKRHKIPLIMLVTISKILTSRP